MQSLKQPVPEEYKKRVEHCKQIELEEQYKQSLIPEEVAIHFLLFIVLSIHFDYAFITFIKF